MEKKVTSYPKEVASIVRNTITLSINSELFVAEGDKGEKPYSVYGQFSRFPITLIDRSNGTRIAKANIGVNEIPDISARTAFAVNKHMESLYTKVSKSVTNLSPAYTVILKSGNNLKSKTPAQVLLESGNDGMTRLNNQKIYLSNNTNPKFARDNQMQIAAIDDAINLYSQGRLNAETAQGNGGVTIPLYTAPYRANVHKPRGDGKCLVTETSVKWIVGNDYPVEIVCTNYYARVNRSQRGAINIDSTGIDQSTRVSNHIKLSQMEWLNIMHNIEMNMKQFEYINAQKVFADAERINQANLQSYKTSQQVVQAQPQPQTQVTYQNQNQRQQYQYPQNQTSVNQQMPQGYGYQQQAQQQPVNWQSNNGFYINPQNFN